MLVLAYHAVSPTWPADLSVTPDALERHVHGLRARGLRLTTLGEAVRRPAADVAVLTFDDAYRSVVTRALPVLRALGVPATVFAPTGWTGRDEPMAWPGIDRWLGGPHEHELVPASWDELAGLRDEGWEVGSHTVTHPRLTALDDAALARELAESRRACEERLGAPCDLVAYPYGDVDARVAAAARAAGYRTGAALPAGRFSRDPLLVPRIGVYHGDGDLRLRLKLDPRTRALRRTRLWDVLRAGRSRLVKPRGRMDDRP